MESIITNVCAVHINPSYICDYHSHYFLFVGFLNEFLNAEELKKLNRCQQTIVDGKYDDSCLKFRLVFLIEMERTIKN